MNLTLNFYDYEFRCFHCGKDGIQIEFVRSLQELRDKVRAPIHINSGYRCRWHPIEQNKYVVNPEHTPGSHELGLASDIRCPDLSLDNFYEIVKNIGLFNGIGFDPQRRFIHVDQKDRKLVWYYLDGKAVYA